MAKIKLLIEPRNLYRYRSLDTPQRWENELSAIENDYLWFSNFDCLNDPMEGSYDASPKLAKDPRFQDIKNYIHDAKMGLGICSFSETNDNQIMWAHYANGFTGICVEYYVPNMLLALDDAVDCVRVHYDEKAHRVYPKSATSSDIAKKILSTKSHRWLYEREWRLIAPNTGRVPLNAKNCVSCVYIGKRMETTRKNDLTAALLQKQIRIKLMQIDSYSITFQAPGRIKSTAAES